MDSGHGSLLLHNTYTNFLQLDKPCCTPSPRDAVTCRNGKMAL
jgi:hypothetical protein